MSIVTNIIFIFLLAAVVLYWLSTSFKISVIDKDLRYKYLLSICLLTGDTKEIFVYATNRGFGLREVLKYCEGIEIRKKFLSVEMEKGQQVIPLSSIKEIKLDRC